MAAAIILQKYLCQTSLETVFFIVLEEACPRLWAALSCFASLTVKTLSVGACSLNSTVVLLVAEFSLCYYLVPCLLKRRWEVVCELYDLFGSFSLCYEEKVLKISFYKTFNSSLYNGQSNQVGLEILLQLHSLFVENVRKLIPPKFKFFIKT